MTEQLLPMGDVKITEFYHIKLCLEYVGAVMVLDKLKALADEFPKLAGIGLSLATVKVEVADMRTRMLTRNIKVAMQNGFDADANSLTMELKKDGIYLRAGTEGEEE